ncbi:MAG TPA: hypothetical protein VNR37_01465 [Microbacteriaceae bacterium]|nr:hypothetical protein [Microbacteriaceae bacterium]
MTAIAERASGRRHAAIGTRRLWLGTTIILAFQIVFNFANTIERLDVYRDIVPVFTGWAVLIVVDAAIVVVTRVLGEHLPNWLFALWYSALALVIALDLTASWGAPNPADTLTVGLSASLSLVLALVTRSTLQIFLSAVGLAVGTAVAWIFMGGYQQTVVHETVYTLCVMLFPVLVAALITGSFRRLMRRETEEMLSHSAIAAPRLTVGIEASEQLARLDLAAESLLSAVADGRMRLPLTEEVARRAGSLATELRLHLLESRSKTWLGLAIEESRLLSEQVRVEDPNSSAGLLNTRQRAALLSALWLLHDERSVSKRSPQEQIVLAFSSPRRTMQTDHFEAISIRVDVPGSTRMMIDPGVWEHFARVGRYREALDGLGMRIDIHCLVPAPRGPSRGRTDS